MLDVDDPPVRSFRDHLQHILPFVKDATFVSAAVEDIAVAAGVHEAGNKQYDRNVKLTQLLLLVAITDEIVAWSGPPLGGEAPTLTPAVPLEDDPEAEEDAPDEDAKPRTAQLLRVKVDSADPRALENLASTIEAASARVARPPSIIELHVDLRDADTCRDTIAKLRDQAARARAPWSGERYDAWSVRTGETAVVGSMDWTWSGEAWVAPTADGSDTPPPVADEVDPTVD